MDNWVVTIISLIISTVITTAVGVMIKRMMNKQQKSQEELNDLRDQRIREERKSDTIEIVNEAIKPIETEINKLSNKLNKLADGTLSTLRNDILTCYYRCNEKGYRNDYDYTNIHDLYEAYKELNGNSFITDIMDRFDRLPTKEEYRKELEKKVAKEVAKKTAAKEAKKLKTILVEDSQD